MFLENETWELCPVKSNFSITQLHVSLSTGPQADLQIRNGLKGHIELLFSMRGLPFSVGMDVE